MRILVSGGSGLIGGALIRALAEKGHGVARLVRGGRPALAGDVHWDPERGEFDARAAEGNDAVVHLAGASIAAGRWNTSRRRVIRDSRVAGTRLLAEGIATMRRPPAVLVCASAIGFYGDRGDEELTETSRAGTGFLADVCRQWEAAAEPAAAGGVRVAHLRFGVVVAGSGGALARMLRPFRLCLGGRLGTGTQWMSWITLEDALGVITHVLGEAAIEGPLNVVAPAPVTNAEFTKALARALRRPAVLPVPGIILRLVLGSMAEELLLASQRVLPAVLQRSGYRFRHPDLDAALGRLFRR